MVYVDLTGRILPGLDLSFLSVMGSTYFHFRADMSELMPEVDLAAYPERERAATTEERFVSRLRPLLEADGPEAETARRALLYGLDALSQRRIEARYEE